jgi:hypothetical protein
LSFGVRVAWKFGLRYGSSRFFMLIRWREPALRLAAMVALFAASLEVSARLDDWLTWQAPLSGDYSHESLTFVDALGPRCRPGGRFEKWQLNAHGFRGPEVAAAKPLGVTRVLIVGASETFGLYESPGYEFPAALQRRLDQARPARFEVLNAACAGMSPPRIVQLLDSWLGQFRPDVVVFYPSPQFYLDDVPPQPVRRVVDRASPAFTPRLQRRVRTWLKSSLPEELQTWLRELTIEREVRRHPPDWLWTHAPEDRVELFRAHLHGLVRSIRGLGAHPVLLTHANRFGVNLTELDRQQLVALRKFFPRAVTTAILPFERAMNQTVLRVAEESGAPAVDIEKRLGKDPALYADFSHFTDQGAQVMADVLSDELLRLTENPAVPGQSNATQAASSPAAPNRETLAHDPYAHPHRQE